MKPWIILFGTKFDLIERLHRLDYNIFLIDFTRNFECERFLLLERSNSNDIVKVEGVLQGLGPIDVRGILANYEYYVEVAAEIRARHFPLLKGLSIAQAQCVRNKLLMKSQFVKAEISTPKFCQIDSGSKWKDLTSHIGAPIIVKPKKEAGARGIQIINSDKAFNGFKANCSDLDSFYAEEYLKNIREFCCDTLVHNGKIISQFTGEYFPSCLESNKNHSGFGVDFFSEAHGIDLNEIKIMAQRSVRALGIRDGFCHIEFMYSGLSWRIGEIGVRLPGGMQIPSESMVAGEDVLDVYLNIFVSNIYERVRTKPRRVPAPYIGYFLYPNKAGTVKKITSQLDQPWIREAKIYVKEGQVIPFEDSSVAMSASIIYQGESYEDLKRVGALARKAIQIEMQS